ncbi:MAG: tRNA (adenosine(37)-N6)-dimethylallyltransferase MiaA [Chloroflexi bacterium]|nr:tRNA (adenosine(37)-N6)-dimethylallyltransferase MiaA [Chloroflexota bacterium]MYD49301.1 tRNA (adenosine(37)-N6)-dimethylallyltransferase MiaA [Chloroflexota bacterium]
MSTCATLVAVVGPTGVGKTALAIALARRFDVEIVNADSRQVYTGMDIGTAKPTAEELRAARHHLINIRRPDAPFSLGEYLPLARDSITDIVSRGKLPILCGGTGQYVWALLEGWQVPQVRPNADLRAELERRASAEGATALYRELHSLDPQRAESIGPHNTRRIIRALEIHHAHGGSVAAGAKSAEPPYRARIIGLTADRATLYQRIDERFDAMMDAGLLDEARRLAGEGYTLGAGVLSGVGYSELGQHLAGEVTLPDAIARAKTQTHRLVRRQYTWFKPADPRIAWLDATSGLPIDAASSLVQKFMESPAPCDTIANDSPRANPGTEFQ